MVSEKNSKRKFSLKNLRIEEISGVDRGANPGAHVLFFKRNPKEEPLDMDLKEITKRLEVLEKSDTDKTAEITKLKADKDALEALAKMSDAEKEFHKALPADKQASFLKADTAVRKAQMDEAKKAADDKKSADDKATDVQKALAPLEKQIADQNAEIKKLRDEKELSEFEKSFDKELPNFGGTADEKTELLKSLKAMPEEARKTLMGQLKKADDIKGQYFIEKGTSNRGADDPVNKLDSLAKAEQAKSGGTYEAAYNKVLATDEGSKLYAASGKQ